MLRTYFYKFAGDGRPRGSLPATDPPALSGMNWQPKDIPFTANPGPINGAAALDSDQPVDFLELFLTDELLQNIADSTNLYAEQCMQTVFDSVPLPNARIKAWKAVTVQELKSFLGLLFLTGIMRKPELEMYWSTDEIMATPYFNKTMSRNRFQMIWRFLHFSDNETADASDRLNKVRPVLDYLMSKFREMYQPNTNISIDEGVMLWQGRLAFKVYNPQKPVKYGIKSYILCDSETGYCFNMKPYCGEKMAVGDTVVSLLDRLAGDGYRLYMDNFDNSVAMCASLIDLKTHVCGTLGLNGGGPPDIKLSRKRHNARHNDTVMVLAWRNRCRKWKIVTTLHQNEMEDVQENRKDRVSQRKPACIVAFNKSMNGVDKLDQNIVYYPCIGKINKWTKKFVAYMFEISLFNAFTIYKAKNPQGNSKCLMSFILSVVKSWARLSTRQVTRAPRAKRHFAVKLTPLPGRKPKSKRECTRKCRVCAAKGERSETTFQCSVCLVPLHKKICFSEYHTELDCEYRSSGRRAR